MKRRRLRFPAQRAQLRVRVLAGVVAVTLTALAAFDVAALTTMRNYLYGDARSQLNSVTSQTHEELTVSRAALSGPGTVLYSSAGQFDVVWLPAGGKPIAVQFAISTISSFPHSAAGTVASDTARKVTRPGSYTEPIAGQMTLLQSTSVPGGTIVAGIPVAQVTNTLNRVGLIIAVGSAAVVLLIGAGVFLVLRRGLRPIETMAVQADRITAGDLASRVTSHHPRSETGRLATALNGMLARIEAAVLEREASQEQMRQFFADASHELRTPIASLLANVELQQHGALTEPAQVAEVTRRMAVETERMARLVDDMLHLVRLGHHPGRSREPVDLTALVADCVARARITDPGRRWQAGIADGLRLVGDEELLRRAVDNLCANVLVHTPPGTVGTVTAAAVPGGWIRIEVSDDGPGVPADKLPRLFERFYRADAGGTRTGSGLGLAIVAEIAAAQGGTAEASSASPHGLRITLTLPVNQTAPAGEPATTPAGIAT